jgi:hypothetical protein
MKKLFSIGVVALLSLASCNKDYTCECTKYDPNTLEPISGTEEKATISSSSKEQAIEDCLAKGIKEEKGCLIK